MTKPHLAALVVYTRRIGLSVFSDTRLEYADTRHLPISAVSATSKTLAFVHWAISTFSIGTVALELPNSGQSERRTELYRLIVEMLRRDGIPIWEVGQGTLFASYAVPPLRKRHKLRAIIQTLWPSLPSKRKSASLDAAALGLYVQTSRLFLD